jgi:ADP-heptose:LPS heptosyltransferase
LRLRKNKYDLAINMRTIVSPGSSFKMYLLLKSIGAKIWAGRNTDKLAPYFDVAINETYKGDKRESEYDKELAEKLGGVVTADKIKIPRSDKDIIRIAELFKNDRIDKENDFIVGINPGGNRSHRWDKNNFIEFIDKIAAGKTKIILVGSLQENDLCSEIQNKSKLGRVFNYAGKLNINQLAELIKTCKIFVSNDTGSIHICMNEGTPGIFIFGPGHFKRFAPDKSDTRYISLYNPIKCSPCELKECCRMDCLKGITVNEVYKSFVEIIRRFYDK